MRSRPICILVAVLMSACVTATDRPRLSPTQAATLANAEVRRQLKYDLGDFHRSQARYMPDKDAWVVNYQTKKALDGFTIQILDKTKKATIIFNCTF